MNDVEGEVRSLIESSPRSLRNIARNSGVDYLRLWRWTNDKSQILRANDAAAIVALLTKPEEKEVA